MNMQSSRGYKKKQKYAQRANTLNTQQTTHNMQKYLPKRIFTCQKTEPNEIGWQTAITTTTAVATTTSTWTGRKSFLAKSICIGNRLVPVAHNAKYAANKSKLTNTNSGGGVTRTARGKGAGAGAEFEALRQAEATAWGHLNMQQQYNNINNMAPRKAEQRAARTLPFLWLRRGALLLRFAWANVKVVSSRNEYWKCWTRSATVAAAVVVKGGREVAKGKRCWRKRVCLFN